jgi:ethanolamine utilization protein EutN
MLICKVIGNIVSTQKHPSYHGKKLLLVKPLAMDGALKNELFMAVDAVEAGAGDRVLVVQEGNSAREELKFEKRQPLRSVIIAVIDQIDLPDKR